MLPTFDMPDPVTRLLRLNGDAGTGGAGDDGQGGSSGGGGDGTDVQLTPEQQAHVDRLIGRARQEGRQTGATATRDEIDAYLAEEKRKADLAAMEEADRLKAERDQAQADAEQARNEAAQVRLAADAQAALHAARLNPEYVADGLALLGHTTGDDPDAIKAKVDALKTRHPSWFTDGEGDPPPPPPGIPPSGGRPANTGGTGESDYERGARLARERPHLRSA